MILIESICLTPIQPLTAQRTQEAGDSSTMGTKHVSDHMLLEFMAMYIPGGKSNLLRNDI